MKLVFKEQVNLIGEAKTSTYTVTTNPITEYGNIPMSIGTSKGDLISFTAAGVPKVIHAGNADGKVLMTDSTTDTGWTLGTGGGGGGSSAAITLTNASGVYIESGTVVYVDDTLGGFKKALSNTVGQLYVTADNSNSGDSCNCYGTKGAVCNVKCTSAAVNIGDQLSVSDNGICAAVSTIGTVGVALTAKEEGSIGTVTVRLTCVAADTMNVVNGTGSRQLTGTVYKINGDANGLPDTELYRGNTLAAGVQAEDSAEDGALTTIHHKPGEIVYVRADSGEVVIGDWLVASRDNPGQVKSGGGYGIGTALENKAEGESGLVKCRLFPGLYGSTPRSWYLLDGITEENVVAAYKFKGVATEQEALTNVNEGTAYALTATGVTWTTGKGLYFPADIDCYINNTELVNQKASIVACAFGYSDMSTGSVATAGVALNYANPYKYFAASGGYYGSDSYGHFTSIPQSASAYQSKYMATKNVGGVLACDWSACKVWYNGLSQSLTNVNNAQMSNANWTYPRVFTTCTNSKLARGTMYLSALVFYNTVLTDAQHVQLANQINAL
jgi:hypothetical protein